MEATTTTTTTPLTLTAYRGDAKTLLAFNLPQEQTTRLAGFTIECQPQGQASYYLHNALRFEHPDIHAQDASEPATSSINAPIHKFRWLHVPGSIHQGLNPFYGPYTYVVTPRYFDLNRTLLPLDATLSAQVDTVVEPFAKDALALRFTRGFVQSQGFINHFGPKAVITPDDAELLFDTSQLAGTNAAGHTSTYAEEYEWLGFTARRAVFDLVSEVVSDQTLRLEMFAYDLDEPDLMKMLLVLAGEGRVRLILDSAALHHSTDKPKPEDQFEALFRTAAQPGADIKRGHFQGYAHDKVMIVSDGQGARTVLTGSTNFSVTGFYVNSNHILRLDDPGLATTYLELFQAVWDADVHQAAYLRTDFSAERLAVDRPDLPVMEITFAPHSEAFATDILQRIATRIEDEAQAGPPGGSVLFAVMQTTGGSSPVWDALNAVHEQRTGFSYGISDQPEGIALYTPGSTTGVIVTGRPARTRLPRPFNEVPSIGSGHQIHHKFVVCGLRSDDPVVFCGSSNLSLGGEQHNGDNLLEIHDRETVMAFAIEALALVDHFQFLNRAASEAKSEPKQPPASKTDLAVSSGWFLGTTDRWAKSYYDPNDLHSVDRELFG